MILELSIAIILGCLAGTFTGIAPGIHINLVAAILVLSLDKFQNIPILALVVFITSMSITHTFIDFIPSIFLGAPEEDNFLSVLPGHRLLLEGKGQEAFILTLYGSIFAIPIILIFTPIFALALPFFFSLIKSIIPFILLLLSFYLVFREKEFLISLTAFLLAGFLGFLTFNLPINQPLLPLLSGLFGISGMIVSIKTKTTPKEQKLFKLREVKLTKKELMRSGIAATLFAPLCSFLPGIGSGHAATLGSEFIEQTNRSFLFLLGAINTIVMGLSYVTAYSISKARTGTAASVQELLKTIHLSDLTIILITIIISAILAFFIGLFLSRLSAKFINKINYSHLTAAIITIVLGVNLYFSNWLGTIVLITGSALGVFTILSSTRRINLMGCLIIPSILYYLTN